MFVIINITEKARIRSHDRWSQDTVPKPFRPQEY